MYQILEIIDSVLGESKPYQRGEYYYYCPLCHHHKPKLAVNVNNKKWHCWKCGESGNRLTTLLWKVGATQKQIQELAILLDDFVPIIAQHKEQDTSLRLPDEFISLTKYSTSPLYKNILRYLTQRGIRPSEVLCYNIGYCETGMYKDRIIIPSYTADGRLNYFVGRSIHPWGLAYLTPQISKNIIGLEDQINWKHPIVLTEGIFDAMAIKRNVIPLFGKHVSKKLREKIITSHVSDVYLALDNDALADSIRHAEKFLKEGINVYVVELNGKDPSELGFHAMRTLIHNTQRLDLVDLMKLKLRLS